MTEKVKCLICGAKRDRTACHIIELTVHERHALRQQGHQPLEEYPYCKPCWNVIKDPVAGPALMKGMAEAHLRGLGVSNAEDIANKFHQGLLKAQKKGS